MKNLIIIFNRLESHPNFNDINISKQTCANFMYEENENYDIIKGYSEELHHFLRLLPNKNIIENSFSTEEGFNREVKYSEILFIHVTNNIKNWNSNFKVKFEEYVSNFSKVHISYHNADVDNGKHTKIENFIKNKNIPYKTENKYHHEYEMNGKEKLYGYLAKAIIDNEGVFSKVEYDKIIDKLITFFPSDNEIKEIDTLNQKLTFLHKLLGGQKGLEEEYKNYHDEYDGLPIFPSEINNEFIKKVRDIILDKVV